MCSDLNRDAAAGFIARGQAEQYVRALPPEEGNPPFVVVTDVGYSIELYSDFSRAGKTYVPFPDSRGHRIFIEDLARGAVPSFRLHRDEQPAPDFQPPRA